MASLRPPLAKTITWFSIYMQRSRGAAMAQFRGVQTVVISGINTKSAFK